MDRHRSKARGAANAAAALALGLSGAPALGHSPHGSGDGYYASLLDGRSVRELASPAPDYPTSLHIEDGDSIARYRLVARRWTYSEWSLLLDPVELTRELVEGAPSHLLLVLPMPADASGTPRFEPEEWGIRPWGRSGASNAAMVLNRERIILKRNVVLEQQLLPSWIGSGSEPDKLPPLAGTRYAYTLWEAIVSGDPNLPPDPVCWATFRYTARPLASVPDPTDDTFNAYVVTWIPALGSEVPPYTLRVDVREPESSQ